MSVQYVWTQKSLNSNTSLSAGTNTTLGVLSSSLNISAPCVADHLNSSIKDTSQQDIIQVCRRLNMIRNHIFPK